MPTMQLTQLAVEKIGAPLAGRVIYWDRLLPGFGLRVTPSGAKSWVAMYRVGGRTVMETIGPLAKTPNVGDARQKARASMEKAAAGTHPVVEKRTAATRAEANTVATVVRRYLDHCDRNLKPKTAREWRRIFEHDVLPRWGDRPLADIAKGDVLELIDAKAARRERKRLGMTEGAAVQANRTLTRLRTFFGWAAANDLVDADPTGGVRKPAREGPRDRVLDDDEIRAFWTATGEIRMPFGPLFRLLLLTAQREVEVANMTWPQLDRAVGIWTIPSTLAKNGKAHVVHLSALAAEVLDVVPEIAGQELLFSGRGRTPASGFSRAKDRLDRLMFAALRQTAGEKAAIAPWVLHDLRRTATTGMARLGIAPHVADRVLNHQAGTIRGVAAVYNRFDYLDERKVALEAWARFVESLVQPGQSNVVQLAGAR